ncbi:DUF4247 domain-containing protein [Staphylococcus chromogenes]|nr:DUF4247 domain-containing protein [Staphylococcus chromogenes]
MDPHRRRIIAAVCGVLSLFFFMASCQVGAKPKIQHTISDTYPHAGAGSYTCEGDVQKVASDIAAKQRPQARQFDSASGTEYLRYRDRIVSVSKAGPTGCMIHVENLDRYHDGGLIWLGPGFGPSAPSGSSGGSSGSGGSGSGVK